MFCTLRPIFIAFGWKLRKLWNILQINSEPILPRLNYPIFEATQILLKALAISRMHFYGLQLTQTEVLAKQIQEKTVASLKSRTLKNSIFPFFDCSVLGVIFWMLIPESRYQLL